jgi:uncharacterized membrane protein YeaQ/YmgE (transglycosylase-associated protein family)
MISLLLWVVFGWIAGAIAEAVWPPAVPGSKMQTICIGIAGSVVGGMVGSVITGSYYQPGGVLLSVVGALLCMFVWRKFNEVKE